MRKRRLLWQLFPSYLLITILSLIAVAGYTFVVLNKFYNAKASDDLEAKAYLLKRQFVDYLAPPDQEKVDALCKELGKNSSTRITVILPNGKVLGDTEENPLRMENHANRPEIQQALRGENGSSIRRSPTLKWDMMYIALPIDSNGEIIGVVRTSIPLISIGRALGAIYSKILLWGLLVAMLAAGFSLYVSKRISNPLEQMKHVAEQFAKGIFTGRLPVSQSEEINGLAQAMKQMAKDIDNRIRTITDQRNEQEAIFSSMVEGVFAVDTNERLLSINNAALDMLGTTRERAVGNTMHGVIRNSELQSFVEKALTSHETIEGQIVLRDGKERYVQTHGTALVGADGKQQGAVIVLNDITKIQKLERIRREFVANVSHELKTPITTISGFVETLMDGALDEPIEAKHFLDVVAKQVDRLNNIIEDLLLLSRLEQDPTISTFIMERHRLYGFLEDVLANCETIVSDKKITLNLSCDRELHANINLPLLITAMTNLIDNAVKYCGDGSSVNIKAEDTGNEIVISVEDEGIGIPKEHLPRIFERFYRVDKGRSRSLGGTGLGLAIVKHIALAHGGSVTVESYVGIGSTFQIHLPVGKPINTRLHSNGY